MPSLGDLVRVRGKVSSHGGQMQVVVTACGAQQGGAATSHKPTHSCEACNVSRSPCGAEVLTDTNVEILHWLDAVSAQTRLEATGQLLAPG